MKMQEVFIILKKNLNTANYSETIKLYFNCHGYQQNLDMRRPILLTLKFLIGKGVTLRAGNGNMNSENEIALQIKKNEFNTLNR